MASVLLATDGSADAQRAARRAIDIADERNAQLCVISVVDRERFAEPALSSVELGVIYAEDHAIVTVDDVKQMARGRGLTVTSDTRHGVPHETILAYADEIGADVIVIGQHGDHAEHFSGVGRRVAEHARCDVVVV